MNHLQLKQSNKNMSTYCTYFAQLKIGCNLAS